VAFWRRPKITYPVPRQLVIELPLVFHLEVERALQFRNKDPLTFDDVWSSRFFRAYVVAYPTWLEHIYPQAGSIYRHDLLQAAFGDRHDVRTIHDQIGNEFAAGNEMVALGLDMGTEDGRAFFEAALKDEPDTRGTHNLHMVVRSLENLNEFPSDILAGPYEAKYVQPKTRT
jgi:hypothetical protein